MSHVINQITCCAPAKRVHLLRRLITLAAVARQRRHLADLDDHLLRDIGITRAEAMQEAQKAPWRAPAHWKR